MNEVIIKTTSIRTRAPTMQGKHVEVAGSDAGAVASVAWHRTAGFPRVGVPREFGRRLDLLFPGLLFPRLLVMEGRFRGLLDPDG